MTKGARAMLARGERNAFNRSMRIATTIPNVRRTLAFRARPYDHTDWYDLYQTVLEYRISPEVAARITTPMLVTDPEREQFWPGQSDQLVDLLPHGAELLHFTAAEGAHYHCQPLGRLLTENRMFDWLEERLHETPSGER